MLNFEGGNIVRRIMYGQCSAFYTHQFSNRGRIRSINTADTMTTNFIFPNVARLESTIRKQLLSNFGRII